MPRDISADDSSGDRVEGISTVVTFQRAPIRLPQPLPSSPNHKLRTPTVEMPSTDVEKEKHPKAGHFEHAYPENTTIHIASAPDAQDPSGPALSPGEKEDKATRKLIRKIDIRLLPVLAIIYAFALIDRVNLPNARIAGMDEDLGLSVGDRYSLVVMIFFVPYVICQFPANIVCRRLGPCLWLPSLAVSWGIVTLGVGFTTNWTQLIACRILLGILEVCL